jgi:hypothetical protein
MGVLLNRKAFDFNDKGELAVVLCHFNPCGYLNPIRNIQRTLDWLAEQKLPTYAAELRCGKGLQSKPILPIHHPKVIQLSSECVLFQKENLWNIVVKRLPSSFHFVLCLDADVVFKADQWQRRLLHLLQTHKVVQPFSHAIWNDSLGRAYRNKVSCLYAAAHDLEHPESGKLYHPGFALASHRAFWDETDGLYNGLFGEGASCFMAGLLGQWKSLEPYFGGLSDQNLSHYVRWAKSIYTWAGGSVCYLEGEAHHFWHGSTKERKYVWNSSLENPVYLERRRCCQGFDPVSDFHIDENTGLITWSPSAIANKPGMVSHVESYFTMRGEDDWYDSSQPS